MGLAIASIAGICGLIGWIWMIVLAFKNGDTLWGFLSICSILGLVYGFMHFQQAKVPTILLLIGMIGGAASNFLVGVQA